MKDPPVTHLVIACMTSGEMDLHCCPIRLRARGGQLSVEAGIEPGRAINRGLAD